MLCLIQKNKTAKYAQRGILVCFGSFLKLTRIDTNFVAYLYIFVDHENSKQHMWSTSQDMFGVFSFTLDLQNCAFACFPHITSDCLLISKILKIGQSRESKNRLGVHSGVSNNEAHFKPWQKFSRDCLCWQNAPGSFGQLTVLFVEVWCPAARSALIKALKTSTEQRTHTL